MKGLLLVAAFVAQMEDPLLPRSWRDQALSLSRADVVVTLPEDMTALQRLGQEIFFSEEISGDGETSCATCHDPAKAFQDSLSHPRGVQKIHRDTPGLWGVNSQRWFGWDGRWDSLWAQALDPIETVEELDSDRLVLLRWIDQDRTRRQLYETSFGEFPDLSGLPERARIGSEWTTGYQQLAQERRRELNLAFSQAGRAVAAYEQTLQAPETSFDRYLQALSTEDSEAAREYPAEARRGLVIYLDRGRCVLCHNGPALSDGEFHDTGLITSGSSSKDSGRYGGILDLKRNPFNLMGEYSDQKKSAAADRTRRLRRDSKMWGAFRTPGLRGVSWTAPYFHDGSREDLSAVIRFYSRREDARPAQQGAGHHGERLIEPLQLTPGEEYLLVEFLKTL